MDKYPDALRADLQRYYNIDLDHAIAGQHRPLHVAALVKHLPSDAHIYRADNPDAAWTLEAIMLADLRNMLAAYFWSMADKRKRGSRPKRIGPSWMRDKARTLEASVMTIDELKTALSKPRKGAR